MNEQHFLTTDGAEKLRRELEQLKGPRREDMAARLRHAVSQGDLAENADYIKAKEDQAFLEGRIQELEVLLRDATIVDGPASFDEVTIGSEVVVQEDGRDQEVFLIVGAKEADPGAGKISHKSPIGQALMGKKAGETAHAVTPGGELSFKVIEIR